MDREYTDRVGDDFFRIYLGVTDPDDRNFEHDTVIQIEYLSRNSDFCEFEWEIDEADLYRVAEIVNEAIERIKRREIAEKASVGDSE